MSEEEYRADLPRIRAEYGIPPPEFEPGDDWYMDDWLRMKRLPAPFDPDSLLAVQPDSGTHSIIDM